MDSEKRSFQTIDEYIATYPDNIQAMLQAVRATVRAAAPDAEECISYGMPAFAQNGIVVYFAGLKNHIGFYPTSGGVAAFESELAAYEHTAGAIRFPFTQPMPADLITRIVRYRLAENLKRATKKKQPTRFTN